MNTYQIHIQGLVQGVGFRPFIHRLTNKFGLTGWVENSNNGVKLEVNCTENQLNTYLESIKNEAPPAATILSMKTLQVENREYEKFTIRLSSDVSNEITLISPDIAVCNECLQDLETQSHRINYPLVNCTNCGPRFSIIRELPYDRKKTTMSEFEMCTVCQSEYNDISDRRFHAQPVACHSCGPHYTLHSDETTENFAEILSILSKIIESGGIAAIKGIGGFHLMCDAMNNSAVQRLRELKLREGKPFAVMFRNLEALDLYTYVNQTEKKILTSWQRPIVLLNLKKLLSAQVSVGLNRVGVMLPYMPFHYLFFKQTRLDAIVLTSGNFSDEPILIDNQEAIHQFSGKVDAIITYNRDIYNRTDDSVLQVIDDKIQILRRSRGFAPSPIIMNLSTEGIFAVGAELVNCFAIGKGNQAILSQHIGDLKNVETFDFYKETYYRFAQLFRFTPEIVVTDLHPDYLSSKFASFIHEQFPDSKIVTVQHHHAHIAACMAENQINEKVIGIAMDGVGMGTDGKIWGGEFFIADLFDFERVAHFEYVSIPGGDVVAVEPWRAAVGYLYKVYGNEMFDLPIVLNQKIPKKKLELVTQMIDKQINSPKSSSAGRLFDAISAITGVCLISTFHAEAPMRLESCINEGCFEYYSTSINNSSISFNSAIKEIINDVRKEIPTGEISRKFHFTVVNVIIKVIQSISNKTGLKNVVLSGGTFQNVFLLKQTMKELNNLGYRVFCHKEVPSNDGGLALGQLAIAAQRRQKLLMLYM
jgi:hydrogenase maturation protein HypF